MRRTFDGRGGSLRGQVFLKERKKAFFHKEIERAKKKKGKKVLPKEGESRRIGKKRVDRQFSTKGTPVQTP